LDVQAYFREGLRLPARVDDHAPHRRLTATGGAGVSGASDADSAGAHLTLMSRQQLPAKYKQASRVKIWYAVDLEYE